MKSSLPLSLITWALFQNLISLRSPSCILTVFSVTRTYGRVLLVCGISFAFLKPLWGMLSTSMYFQRNCKASFQWQRRTFYAVCTQTMRDNLRHFFRHIISPAFTYLLDLRHSYIDKNTLLHVSGAMVLTGASLQAFLFSNPYWMIVGFLQGYVARIWGRIQRTTRVESTRKYCKVIGIFLDDCQAL